jgi:hypothetical protein
MVTALDLAVPITMFAPASGAHFNLLVTAPGWLLARRSPGRRWPGLAAG